MENDDQSPTTPTEAEVVDRALTFGVVLFIGLLVGTVVLERLRIYPHATRYFPYAITGFALLGVVWLLWKSPMNPR